MIGLNHPVICVVGPTASGKSDLAQMIAVEVGGNIISADSMQIYKGMDIGTAKVPLRERRVPHFGLDLVEAGDAYSAALFQSYARHQFLSLDSRGIRSILVGGTGFYVRAAIDGYEFAAGEQTDNPVREHYGALAREQGGDAVWEELYRLDPESAHIIHRHDTKRVIRALEMFENGQSYARLREQLSAIPQVVPAQFIGIAIDRDVLRNNIDARIDHMREAGLVQEVEELLNQGLRAGITAPQAIGYKEIVAYLDGEITEDEAFNAIRVATKRYAKRQMTWFRKDTRIQWIEYSTDVSDMFEQARTIIEKSEKEGSNTYS